MSRKTQFRLLVLVTLGWLSWAVWSFMDEPDPFTLRVVDDVGAPVSNAVVAAEGRQLGLTGESGLLEVAPSGALVQVSAPGHFSSTFTITPPDDGVFDVVLKALMLRGRVADPDGTPVADVTVEAGAGVGHSDEEGRFIVRGAEPGTVRVSRPAWQEATFEWSGGPGEQQIQVEPIIVKAVHMTGEAVEERLEEFLELADTTELNGLMIDLKAEEGVVLYRSRVPTVAQVGADAPRYDLAEVVEAAKAQDLYMIGRIVAFQDPVAAQADPDMAVWDEQTGAPFSSNGQYFLDPTDPEARAYALDLATEACSMGLDEVQFDYVRFPDVRPESVHFDAGVSLDVRAEAIRSFIREATEALHPLGCAVGVDVFGFVTTSADDGGIGQRWEDITSVGDVVSPMIYPSHYDSGWYGLEDPSARPDVVVNRALADAVARSSGQVVIRPWLQDFGYNAAQVRQQIDAAESHGMGWMLWNAMSEVSVAALERE
ncbi:MAG TPA: putative glycoside hydrolase [Acidimicrobiia bacterium]|nr:putative glycoside hydrolase [Acidimicrobiia bacterium]